MGNDYGIYLDDLDYDYGVCNSNEIYDNTFSDNGEDIYSTSGSISCTFFIGLIIIYKKVFRS